MAKKQAFIIVDTETTIRGTVADFSAIVFDRQGNILAEVSALVLGHFKVFELFHNRDNVGFWTAENLRRRHDQYADMLNHGERELLTVAQINARLADMASAYSPDLCAYNLDYDQRACRKTGIDLAGFEAQFCLWHAACGTIAQDRKYKAFALQHHLFNNRTPSGCMSLRTDAEAIGGFLSGAFEREPHTAREDILGWEVPILLEVIKRRKWRDKAMAYNYRRFQVRDHYKAK